MPIYKIPSEALPNIEVEMLPRNMTAAIRPMNEGAIAWLKQHIMNAREDAIFENILNGLKKAVPHGNPGDDRVVRRSVERYARRHA